ncbi:MAG: hypothetical protein QXJ32_02215 [Thermoplasmata archaeon]
MFPEHCKEVSVKKVDFELTPESIKSYLRKRKVYIRSRYFVLNSGDDWAVALVVKKLTNEVLQEVASVHVLSLPHETTYIEEPGLEIMSASAMGALREKVGSKCVVVKGKAEHVSFFIDEPPYRLTVFDVVPPAPSKLVGLVQNALDTYLQNMYVKVDFVSADLNELAASADTDTIMFPCRASGLVSKGKTLFLDETPELGPEELAGVTLVGCSLSARIFKAVYGVEPKLINICPKDLLRKTGIQGPKLIKCCQLKEGYEVEGDLGIVPWGARTPEVVDALRAILR